MILIMLGAPGAGKGTQTRKLSEHFNIPQISTGDILRDHVKRQTEIGKSIEERMRNGIYVPDELVIRLVKDRITGSGASDSSYGINSLPTENGFILDGFPRTLVQAIELDNIMEELGMKINKAISVDVSDEIIVGRMSGRLTCPGCGAMVHVHYYPPIREGICDICGTELIQREDDKAKTVLKRLEIYHELTKPIIRYYEHKNMLLIVDGRKEIDEITGDILKNL